MKNQNMSGFSAHRKLAKVERNDLPTQPFYFKVMKMAQEYLPNCWKRRGVDLSDSIITGFVVLSLTIIFSACGSTSLPEPPTAHEPGQLTEGEDVFGTFYAYVPTTIPEKPEILVLVHGTPLKDETTESNAEYYATNWIDFAEKQGFILIVPAFNQEDFSSRRGDHALSGYRGLFGRQIGADEWVLRLVEAHQEAFGSANERFHLYGHSAGGQFTGRFLVTHPEYVKKAVITSAATYPQPNTEVAWPFGMGELHTDIEWDPDTVKHVDVVPDKQKWLAATQIPLTVIVGLNDTAELPISLIPGQKGKNRCTIARNWIQDMAAFAEANGLESCFRLEIVPGKGHSMSGLIPYSQGALVSQ
jgi:predicted esterase